MGKHKSRRYKLHRSAPSTKSEKSDLSQPPVASPSQLPAEINANVFEGIDILSLLDNAPKKPFDDDTISVKSYISNKSIKGENIMPKKEKRKLRRQLLLRKIDTVNQLKKEHKQKKKKETLGGMESLLAALPKLEHLPEISKLSSSRQSGNKKKAIEKSKKVQKKTLQNVTIYKKLLKNPQLAKDPFGVLSQHLKAVVEKERMESDKNSMSKKIAK